MDELRFYQKPWFFFFATIVVLGGMYWYLAPVGETTRQTLWLNGLNFLLCGGGFLLWLGFFAQFVLPVRKFKDRQKIFDRIFNTVLGSRGPAIFIENGNPRLSHEEEKRKGAGVIWLDTASAAVLRTPTKFTRAIGPGVVFTNGGERIDTAVDLHTQIQALAPRENDDPFAKEKKGEQSDEEFKAMLERCEDTKALTRDGIEVVPNISVIFKIDANPAKDKEPGSRFGYDKDAIFKAVAGQGINPEKSADPLRHRVAWNELPARLAADLWREYLSKFTLSELFDPSRPIPNLKSSDITATQLAKLPPPAELPPIEPVGVNRYIYQSLLVINQALDKLITWCEIEKKPPEKKEEETKTKIKEEGKAPKEDDPTSETAMQVIARMVKDRLQNEYVQGLNRHGQWESVDTPHKSNEYDILKKRGLKVIAVSIGNLRFSPDVDEQLVKQFGANWLDTAKREQTRIEAERNLAEHEGRDRAKIRYATALSRELVRSRPTSIESALQTLARGSRSELIRDNNLRRRVTTEVDALTTLIQWVDRGSDE